MFLFVFFSHTRRRPPPHTHFFVWKKKLVFPHTTPPPQKSVTQRERDTRYTLLPPPPCMWWTPKTTHSLFIDIVFSLFFFSYVDAPPPPPNHLSLLCREIRLQTLCKKSHLKYQTKEKSRALSFFWHAAAVASLSFSSRHPRLRNLSHRSRRGLDGGCDDGFTLPGPQAVVAARHVDGGQPRPPPRARPLAPPPTRPARKTGPARRAA